MAVGKKINCYKFIRLKGLNLFFFSLRYTFLLKRECSLLSRCASWDQQASLYDDRFVTYAMYSRYVQKIKSNFYSKRMSIFGLLVYKSEGFFSLLKIVTGKFSK